MMRRGWFVLAALAIVGCDRPTAPTGEDFQEITADLIMVGMRSYMTNSGIRKAQIIGDTAYVYDDSSKIHVKKVNLTFFDESGAESGTLTAKTGDFTTSTQAMIARGSVVLVTKAGNKRIETEELHYDPQTHRIWSNTKTLMIEAGSRVRGDGFTADDKFQNVKITNPEGRVSGSGIRF
jgi:LPS export ABC transporter protein LptC